MSSQPWFKFYPGDYLGDTRRLTQCQHGAYLLILLDYYANSQPPPDDDEVLCRISQSASLSDWKAIRKAIEKYFTVEAGLWRHERCEDEIRSRLGEKQGKRLGAQKTNKIRWGVSDSDSLSVSQTCRNTRSQKSYVRSQTPETINQKPENAVKTVNGHDASLCSDTWSSYAAAYAVRYQTEPVRNKKVNSQIKQLVERLGKETPLVASFYLTHNGPFYVRSRHPLGALLKDAEGLHTQWATGVKSTTLEAKSLEQYDAVSEQLRRLRA